MIEVETRRIELSNISEISLHEGYQLACRMHAISQRNNPGNRGVPQRLELIKRFMGFMLNSKLDGHKLAQVKIRDKKTVLSERRNTAYVNPKNAELIERLADASRERSSLRYKKPFF